MPKKIKQGTAGRPSKGRPPQRRADPASASEQAPTAFTLDDYDNQIINFLRDDGRISVRDLAARTGLTEPNVRARLRRLEDTGTIHITAMVNIDKLGRHCMAPVGIRVKGRSAEVVGRDLANIPEVVTVTLVTGSCDIELQVLTHTLEDLDRVISREIPSVRGVAKVESSLALEIAKYESRWVPFT